jgi:hypothetical protein
VLFVVTGFVAIPGAASADPVSDLLAFVEGVAVDSRDPEGATTVRSLEEGVEYRFVVSGTYQYGGGDADAECANLGTTDATYLRDRFAGPLGPDILDVKVNGLGVGWTPTTPNTDGCNGTDHTYELAHRPTTTDRVTFAVADLNHRDNMGVLQVQIFRRQGIPADGTEVDRFSVPANAAGGRNSTAALQAGTPYRIVVAGSFSFGVNGATHDAECLRVADGPGQRMDSADEQGQGLDLLLNNAEVDWTSPVGLTGCNDDDFTYFHEVVPSISSQINLRVRDVSYGDNFGTFDVTVFRLTAAGGGSAPSAPLGDVSLDSAPTTLVEEVRVDSASDRPTMTALPLVAGVEYTFVASGTYRYNADGVADAECANLGAVDPAFQRDRFAATVGPHALDVTFNNIGIGWEPVDGDPDDCNAGDHRYRFFHTPATTGNGQFVVADGNRRDNSGVITVQILRTEGLPRDGSTIDEFSVSAAAAAGRNSNVSLTAGSRYRIVASGRFSFGVTGATHDAECLRVADGPGQRLDAADERGQGIDALVNASQVNWVSPFGVTGCNDRTSTYYLEFVPTVAGPINVRIRDISYGDNAGGIVVRIEALP